MTTALLPGVVLSIYKPVELNVVYILSLVYPTPLSTSKDTNALPVDAFPLTETTSFLINTWSAPSRSPTVIVPPSILVPNTLLPTKILAFASLPTVSVVVVSSNAKFALAPKLPLSLN